jgi:3-phenylpropionate/cinnamic acid dioxygenase small subunit
LTIGLLAVFASVAWVWAQGRGSAAGALSALDYAEIRQLHMRYAQGTDFGNAEMWLGVFTQDASFNPGANNPGSKPQVGREALTKWRANNFANRKLPYHYRHWPGTFVITPTTDGNARGRVYWMAFNPTTNPRTITDTGFYDDVYIRTPEGWRIKERDAHSDPQPDK